MLSCARASPPSFEELWRQGYAKLDQGDLSAADGFARQGRDRALERGDAVRAWSFRVLQAEVAMRRRAAQEVLALLGEPEPPGTPPEVRVRGLMTEGFARCYLATDAKADSEPAPAVREHPQTADQQLREAERLAAQLTSRALSAEVGLRRASCFHLRGDFSTTEALLQQVLATANALGLRHIEASAAGNMGVLRLQSGRYDDAADWLERSLAASAGLHADIIEAKLLLNLGWCYTMLGDTEKALSLLGRAETMARSHGYVEELELALAHTGSCHLQRGQPQEARRSFAEALLLARRLRRREDERELLDLLQTAALQSGDRAGAAGYERESAAFRPASDRTPLSTEVQLEIERGDFGRAEALYRRWIDSAAEVETRWRAYAGLAQLYSDTARPRDAARAFRQAHDAVEQMRATLRQDTFGFLLFSSLTDFYGRYAAFLVDQGRAAEALAVVDGSRGRVLWAHVGGAPHAPASPRRFEPVARASRAVLLSYWIGERSFVWVVTPEGTTAHKLPPAEVLRARIDRYQALLLRGRDPLEVAPEQGVALYELLVGPAAAAIPKGTRVVVVADGPLHQLSFDTLVVPRPRPHYWLEDVVSVRAPSLAALSGQRLRTAPPDRALLVVGDPIQPSEAFPELPNAAREIASVRRHFPPAATVVLAGKDATAYAVRSTDTGRFGLIHFAAHTASNREQPLESAVVLSRNMAGYKLYARDVLALHIRAEVVTLSACEGAGSRTYGGEGLVGLAWAFLRAGARHVVAALWNVEDASTARLMDDLYAGLAQGLPPPEALREARLALLRSRGPYRKPFYWGPFVVYAQQYVRMGRARFLERERAP